MNLPAARILAAIDKVTGIDPAHVDRGKLLDAHRSILVASRARIQADSAWPSHQEELTRKATDTAHAIVHRLSEGELTQEAAHAALGAIIDTSAGLIDRAALDVLNTAYRSLRP